MKTIILLWFLGAASVVLAGFALLNEWSWAWKWFALLIIPGLIARHILRQRRARKAIIPALAMIGQGHAKAILDRVKLDTGITIGSGLWLELQRLEMTGEIEANWSLRNGFGAPRHRVYRITPPRKTEVVYRGRPRSIFRGHRIS